MKHLHPETLALHAGHDPGAASPSRAAPIHQTTSFLFRDADHAADLFALKEEGFIYTRMGNPTPDVLEKRLAALHGAPAAVCTSSGMAAIFYTAAAMASAGCNIVSGSNLYGGTHTLFEHTLKRFGIEVRFVDSSDPDNFRAAADEGTRFFYSESIGNPGCNVDDLEGIAAAAKDCGLPFVLDCTVSPPPMFDPFAAGADLAVYSLTKIIGGHGTSLGGAVVDAGTFDWARSGNYPQISDPDPTYNNLDVKKALCGEGEPCPLFAMRLRMGLLRDIGAALSPMNAFLILQGVETLPLRIRAHCENALAVASFLREHPAVARVNYAGLPGSRDNARARKYFSPGPGAVFGFGLKGGLEAGKRFVASVELCSHLANILDAKTLVIHPAGTTHAQMTPEEQRAAGVPPDLIRISVGLEHIDDILADLDQALEKAGG